MSILPKVASLKLSSSKLYDFSKSKEEHNSLKTQMEKVSELKIYLKHNFNKNDINNNFIKDLETEYACQFLDKLGMLPLKKNIQKILKLRPIEQCDFNLTMESTRNKPVKLLHLYPNNKKSDGRSMNLKQVLSNEEFEQVMNKTYVQSKEDDRLTNIKKVEIKKDEMNLYIRDNVDYLISKAKEDILEQQLFTQSHGVVNQNMNAFDLSIEGIKNKYLNPSYHNIISNKDIQNFSSKAKFQNIEKSTKKDIFNDIKYEFPYLEVNLNKDILNEVGSPIDIPIETIMKDINHILDNLPIDQLINFKNEHKIITPHDPKVLNASVLYKIKSISKQDVIYVYKRIQTTEAYKLVGLLVNLLYWIVFGYINRIQIDRATKQHIFFKILEGIQNIQQDFKSDRLFHKLFMPIFILVLRLECEAVFKKKFRALFEDKENFNKSLGRINELITIIFDPNCYFNTFTVLGLDMAKNKHRISKNMYPKYKGKINVTSNLVNQLFSNFSNEQNVRKFAEIGKENNLMNDAGI